MVTVMIDQRYLTVGYYICLKVSKILRKVVVEPRYDTTCMQRDWFIVCPPLFTYILCALCMLRWTKRLGDLTPCSNYLYDHMPIVGVRIWRTESPAKTGEGRPGPLVHLSCTHQPSGARYGIIYKLTLGNPPLPNIDFHGDPSMFTQYITALTKFSCFWHERLTDQAFHRRNVWYSLDRNEMRAKFEQPFVCQVSPKGSWKQTWAWNFQPSNFLIICHWCRELQTPCDRFGNKRGDTNRRRIESPPKSKDTCIHFYTVRQALSN